MATSLMSSSSSVNLPSILSPLSSTNNTYQNQQKMLTGFGLSKTNKLFSSQSKRVPRSRNFKSLIAAAASSSSYNDIPKEFREENLKDGLMENFKNVPEQLLYGLSPSQINLFATEDSPIFQQSAKLEEESLSSTRCFSDSWGMSRLSGMKDGGQSTFCSMNASMDDDDDKYNKGGYRRRRAPSSPPDVPSALLHNRIVYLGLPMVDAVVELIVAELVYLLYIDPEEPISLYLHCTGTKNDYGQIVADPENAYAIADMLSHFNCRIYTLNLGVAYGQAAMLLSLGTKGYRFVGEDSFVQLYLPSLDRVDGTTTNIYHQAKGLQTSADSCLEFLSKGIGKSEDELREALRETKFFNSQQAMDFGIADKLFRGIVKNKKTLYKNYKEYIKAKREREARPKFGEREASPSGS